MKDKKMMNDEVVKELKELDYENMDVSSLIKYKSLILRLKESIIFLEEKSTTMSRIYHICELIDLSYGLNSPYNIRRNFNSVKSFIERVEKKIPEEKILELLNTEYKKLKINTKYFLGTHPSQTSEEVKEYVLSQISICEELLYEYNEISSKKTKLLKMAVRNLKDNEIKTSMNDRVYLGRKKEDGIEIVEFQVDSYYFIIHESKEEYTKKELKRVLNKHKLVDYFGKKFYPNIYV